MSASYGIAVFMVGGGLSFVLSRVFMTVASAWGLVDRPGHRKTHRQAVPYLGGLAVFASLGFTLLILFGLWKDHLDLNFSWSSLGVSLLPAFAAMVLGLWDDIKDIRPRYKFLIQVLIAVVFTWTAYRFHAFHLPGVFPWALNPFWGVWLTSFFMVALANGFNMVDGSDGLCAGSAAVSLLLIAALAQMLNQFHFMLSALAAAGACLGFLIWNRAPAKIYLGDAGSQGLGFLVAALLVALGNGEPGQFQTLLPNGRPWQPFFYQLIFSVFIVAYPALEVGLTVFRRSLQGRSLGRGDQGHLHYRLQRLGLSATGIVFCAIALNLLSGGIVLAFLASERGVATVLAMAAAVLVALGLQQLGYTRFLQRRWLEKRRPHYAMLSHFTAMQCAKLELSKNLAEAFFLLEQACVELDARECRVRLRSPGEKTFNWSWISENLHPPQGITADRVRLPAKKSHASWTLDLNGREVELDMNLRVVMAEFMRRTLTILCEHYSQLNGRTLDAGDIHTLSVGKLKDRL